jgi:signal transduction histidine kinase
VVTALGSPNLPPPWDGEIHADESFLQRTRELSAADPALGAAIGREALRQAEARGDHTGAVWALMRIVAAEGVTGDAAGQQAVAELSSRAASVGDLTLRARAYLISSVNTFINGSYADGLHDAQQGIELAQAIGRNDLLLKLLHNASGILRYLGEYEIALDLLGASRRLIAGDEPDSAYMRSMNDLSAAEIWRSIALSLGEQGDEAEAQRALAKAQTLGEHAVKTALQLQDRFLQTEALYELVSVLVDRGDPTAAQQWIDRTAQPLAAALEPGSFPWALRCMMLARVALAQPGCDMAQTRTGLDKVAALDLSRMRRGDFRGALLQMQAQAAEGCGDLAAALSFHKRWGEHELRARSRSARERAKALERSRVALRSEAMEFITHDLRSPLAAAIQQLDSLTEGTPNPIRVEDVRRAAGAARRAMQIADQSLGIMRAEFTPTTALQTLDLGLLADDVCEHMAPIKGVRLVRNFQVGAQVLGDRTLLWRALANLLDNALIHAPAASTVTVTVAADGEDTTLSVADAGPGLSEAMRLRLFRRYATEREHAGHGLGLALVSRVARLHKARIDVHALAPSGTRIGLVLPTHRA